MIDKTEEELKLPRELEEDVIALSLFHANFFHDISDHLKPSHFSNERERAVWTVILQHFGHYHSIPKPAIVLNYFSDGDYEFEENYFQPDRTVEEYLLNEVIDKIKKKEFVKLVFTAAAECDKDKPELEPLLEQFKDIINIQPISDIGLDYYDLDARFSKLQEQDGDKLPTSIPIIDNSLGGGLSAKELYAIAAPPGVGKSYFLVISGAHMFMEEKKNVLHYTLELSEEKTSLRYDMAILNETDANILGDIDTAKSRLEHIQSVKATRDNRLIIKEFPYKSASVNTFRTHIHKLKEQLNFIPDVLIVDYGDIMKSVKNLQSRYEEQGAIFQELRGLAQELGIPVLTATQTNRGSVEKDLNTMADLGDSFDKARTMDGLWVITQRPDEKEDGLMRVYSGKIRNGASGKIYSYQIDYPRAQLKELGEYIEDEQ
jgi:replicative DNA helicase